jgi:hypothetical protein
MLMFGVGEDVVITKLKFSVNGDTVDTRIGVEAQCW